MTPNEYQALAMRTKCDQARLTELKLTEPCIQLNHAALGLAGDAGELCNALAKHLYYRQSLNLTNVIEELGDCLWYIAEACEAIGVSMEGVMNSNIHKLQVRYPDKYRDECAAEQNRNRQAEQEAIELVVHDPVVGDVMLEPQEAIEESAMCGKYPIISGDYSSLPLTSKDVDEITRLPKQSKIAKLCPKCGAKIDKRMAVLVENWMKIWSHQTNPEQGNFCKPAYPCPDCNQPLTELREIAE